MRKLFSFLARPIVWSTLGLALLLFALYFVCDLLRLDDSRWLVELAVGAPLSIFLIAYWLRRFLLDRRLTRELANQARKQAAVAGPDALRDFKAFEEEFKRAFGELNDACRKRGLVGGAAALPWIMVMGPPAVGKTTALDRSGLRFTSLGRRLHGIGPTRNCTWWLASDAIFLDTAGRYAVVDEDKQEWAAFLRLLQRRRSQPLDAVVLQVGLDEILDRSPAEIERAALVLRERLDEISDLLGVQTPVHVLFNKCDLLDGFLEFFADLSDDERREPWGFAIETAQPGRTTSLRERFDAGLDSLLGSLRTRLSSRVLVQGERSAREAVLGFPDEVEALREPLRRFTETLLGADGAHGTNEQPRLTSVYLASAAQTADRRSGVRHRLGADLGVAAGGLRGVLPQISEGTFFLRGVFSHIIRQAEHAVRPSQQRLRRLRYEQRIATLATAGACLAASWFLSRNYRADVNWLDELQQEVTALRASPGVGRSAKRADERQIGSELERQTTLLRLLGSGPRGALEKPHRLATAILRQRIDEQWLQPLEPQLQSGLKLAAETQHEQASPMYARDFRLLQALSILTRSLKTNPKCQNLKPEDEELAVSPYLIEQWQLSLGREHPLLDPRPEVDEENPQTAYGRLRAALRFRFGAEDVPAPSGLSFDAALLREASERLKAAGSQPPDLLFVLRASAAQLYQTRTALRTERVVDPGIADVFTMAGCTTFFDKKTAEGKEWWSCLLDIDEPRDKGDLLRVYQDNYTRAWGGWLKTLSLRNDPKMSPDLLTRSDEALDALTRPRNPELTQTLKNLGRGRLDSYVPGFLKRSSAVGCMGKLRGTATRANREIQEGSWPEACKASLGQFQPFAQLLLPKPKEGEATEDEEGSGRAAELYGKVLESGQKLHSSLATLRKMAPNKKPEGSLLLVQNTMEGKGDLSAFDDARRALIADLRGRVDRLNIDLPQSGLNRMLEGLEADIWLSVLPAAARRIDDQWRLLLDEWKLLKEKDKKYASEDPETCPKILEFVNTKVKAFSGTVLAPYYEGSNPAGCHLTRMEGPFAKTLPLDGGACFKVQEAIRIAMKTDCGKAMGAAGGAAKAKPKPYRADVMPPLNRAGCQFRAVNVALDDGEQLHTCGISSARCKSEPSQEKRPRLQVLWADRSSYDTYAQGDDYYTFLRRYSKIESTEITFTLPPSQAPGNCEGIRVIFQIPATGGGGGGGGGGKPDDKWKDLDLPASLLHKGS